MEVSCTNMGKGIKAIFINLPLRQKADETPPVGLMAVIKSLKKAGYSNVSFLNLDVMRLSRADAISHIVSLNPALLCISAPTSTHYENCKTYSLEIKRYLPGIKIIMGGNMAASAEVILKYTGIDFCVLGEGEKTACELFDAISADIPLNKYREIKGLAFLDGEHFVNTGYAEQLPKEEIFDIDWDTLDSNAMNYYFPSVRDFDPQSYYMRCFFKDDNGHVTINSDMLYKKIGNLFCSKGCVARCTFCHRFTKGIRLVPLDTLERRIREIVERFNVGVISFSDECFGANIKWLTGFCDMIKPFNLLWRVSGMRVNLVNPDIIKMMKDAGCRTIIYGMESGSQRMLKVMQKAVNLDDNYNAIKWTINAGVFSTPQIVIGMPGESPDSIHETADFVAYAMTLHKSQNPRIISPNYAQALPGTPLYEYGRVRGLFGTTIEAEEDYLLKVSNRNAADLMTTLNFSDYPRLMMLSWRRVIVGRVNSAYLEIFGKAVYYEKVFPEGKRPGVLNMILCLRFTSLFLSFPVLAYRLRNMLWVVNFVEIIREQGFSEGFRLLKELLVFMITKSRKKDAFQHKSLRKILEEDPREAYSGIKEMEPLRRGR